MTLLTDGESYIWRSLCGVGSCGWEGGIPQGRQSWTLWALHRQKQKLAQSPGDRGVGQGSDSVHVGGSTQNFGDQAQSQALLFLPVSISYQRGRKIWLLYILLGPVGMLWFSAAGSPGEVRGIDMPGSLQALGPWQGCQRLIEWEKEECPGVHTERRLQGMSCLGAPACRVDVWVIGVNPEIIVVTPAIKVELGKKGPRGSGIALGAQLRQEVGWAQRFSPSLCQAPGWRGRTQGPPTP